MKIEFNKVNFTVNQDGELEYHGKIIEVHKEYQLLNNKQKKYVLLTILDWANNELENFND